MTDVIRHGRPASTTKTVQVLTSNIPIDQLTKAADGGGLRGFRRGARGIAEQARLQVQQVEVVTSSGRRVAISTSKAGLVIGGVAIGWSALLAAGAFTALDMKAQADRRAHEDRVETLLEGLHQEANDRRLATQRANERSLGKLLGRVLDGDTVQRSEMEALQLSISTEFEDAKIKVDRLRWDLERFKANEMSAKELIDQLGLAHGGQAVERLAHAKGAIQQQQRALLLELAVATLLPDTTESSHFAGSLQAHAEEVDAALGTLDAVVEELRSLDLSTTVLWEKRNRTRLVESLNRSIAISFPDVSSPSQIGASANSMLVIDEDGEVYVLDPSIDIDERERQSLLQRFAADIGAVRNTEAAASSDK